MIKTLIFDLGKVIVNFDHSRIIQRIEKSCDLKSEEIYRIVFTSTVVRDYETGKISSLKFFEEVKKLLSLRMTFLEFSDAWNSTFDLEPILSESFIDNLSQKYRLLVLSDTNELHFEFIKANFPILKYFDDFVLSYQAGAVKPFPQIFLSAIEKANCLAEECLFTDDREGNILGAKEVGINAIQFLTTDKFIEDLQKLNLI